MAILKFLTFDLLVTIVVCSDKNETAETFDILRNPCSGRKNGFARDLEACERYFYCENGIAYPGVCDLNYVFDAENEICVLRENAGNICFRCRSDKLYELHSVPKACSQFIECFNGRPTLHICPNGLVFDGRTGIHQCNRAPRQGGCYREDPTDIDQGTCKSVYDKPIFIVDPRYPSVYYVCYGQERPQYYKCPEEFDFDVYTGTCNYPRN